MSILTPCFDGTLHKYATIQEQKNKVFAIEYQSIKSEIDMKFTFALKIKLKKGLFTAKYDHSFY